MNLPYIGDIPNPPHTPATDVPDMRTNTNSIQSWVNVDHRGFNTNDNRGGYHTIIHQAPQVSDPAKVPGIGQTYTKTVSGDQQLFYESGSGIITQLTGGAAPSPGTNGYVYLDGGILLQWGTKAGSSASSIPVLFITSNINFPNNCFNVQVVASRASSSPGSDFATVVVNGSVSTSGFTIGNIGGHSVNNWFWVAIGN